MEELKVENLSHRFGYYYTLKDINFEIKKGECISIIGPSGGGKSTLLRLCAKLEDVQEGVIYNSFNTKSIAFQDARLLPWKNTIENIILGLFSLKIKKKDAVKQAEQIALKFGLKKEDFIKYPKDLSGGMMQRVSLARSLISNPNLLFLDEPFSALDIGIKKELILLMLDWLQENKGSLFFITHNINEAIMLSDRIFLLKAEPGQIVKEFAITKPKWERDDKYIAQKSIELLKDEELIETFTWEIR